MQTTAQLGARVMAQLPQEEREQSTTLSLSGKNGESNLPLLLSQTSGKPVVDPNDPALQFRVAQAFWAKLQRPDVLQPDSPYRPLAVQILEQAAELGWTADDLEAGCKRFQAAEQFGDRIEIAKFFKQAAETLHPYSWVLEQVNSQTAKFTDFDGYSAPGHSKPKWRKHDGKRIESLQCVVWQGKNIAPVIPVEAVINDPLTGQKHEIPMQPKSAPSQSVKDYAALAAENITLKAKLAEAEREREVYRTELEFHKRRIDIKEQVRELEKRWEKEGAAI